MARGLRKRRQMEATKRLENRLAYMVRSVPAVSKGEPTHAQLQVESGNHRCFILSE